MLYMCGTRSSLLLHLPQRRSGSSVSALSCTWCGTAVKREQPCKLERKPVSSGFAPCGPAPNFMPDLKTGPLLPPLRFTRSKTCRAGGKDLEDALCEAGIVGLPMRRSHSDGLALSSSTAYPGLSSCLELSFQCVPSAGLPLKPPF